MLAFFENKKYEKFNKFLKENVWIIPIIYITGTIILLFRNKIYGLHFAPISVIQFSLLVVYLILFVAAFAFLEYNIIAFIEILKSNQKKNKKFKIIGTLIWHIVLLMITSFILIIIIGENRRIVVFLVGYYILYPIFSVIIDKNDILSDLITISVYVTLILEIPISIGGFKGQDVTYQSINDSTNYEYTYFGN